jgi:hypothetical protein
MLRLSIESDPFASVSSMKLIALASSVLLPMLASIDTEYFLGSDSIKSDDRIIKQNELRYLMACRNQRNYCEVLVSVEYRALPGDASWWR